MASVILDRYEVEIFYRGDPQTPAHTLTIKQVTHYHTNADFTWLILTRVGDGKEFIRLDNAHRVQVVSA